MIRDILDWEGNVVGEMTLDDSTSEDVWVEKLSAYAKPPAQSTAQYVNDKVSAAEDFGRDLLRDVSTDNILAGATTDQINQLIADHKDVIIMLMSGSLYTALDALSTIEVNDLLTQARLDKYASKIRTYLGIPQP